MLPEYTKLAAENFLARQARRTFAARDARIDQDAITGANVGHGAADLKDDAGAVGADDMRKGRHRHARRTFCNPEIEMIEGGGADTDFHVG